MRVGNAELLVSPMGGGVFQDGGGSVDCYVLAGSLRAGKVTVSRRSGEYLDLINARNGEVANIARIIVKMQRLRHRLAGERGVVHL